MAIVAMGLSPELTLNTRLYTRDLGIGFHTVVQTFPSG